MIQSADNPGTKDEPGEDEQAPAQANRPNRQQLFGPVFAAAAVGPCLSATALLAGAKWDWNAEQSELIGLADSRRATIQEGLTDLEQMMLAQADLALYRAKEEGRDQYRFHSEELDRDVRERVLVTDELRTALDRNEFELYYQPQVEFSTGEIAGMEALIRWNHPTRGLLKPDAFIAIAEKTGAIIAIGQWVLEQACKQMSQWRKDGIAPHSIAVNVSLAQLKTTHEFIQCVTDTLARWNLAPADLELDVTEAIMAHAKLTQSDVIEKLHKLGVKIAIDDFGTQYSSLDYLKTYSVNRLKIPQRMIEAARNDAGNAAMVRAIVGIARELKVEIIAQGVETEAQWSFLTEAAPHAKVQGYYYSMPVQADRAAAPLQCKHIEPSCQISISPEAGPHHALQKNGPASSRKERTGSAVKLVDSC